MAVERRLGLLACVAALAAGPAAAALQGPGAADANRVGTAAKPSRAVAKAAPTHTWHDGAASRPLVLQPGWIADFAPGAPAVLRRADLKARPSPLTSPVWRDDAGRLRALPGGVLLVLGEPTDDARAARLFRQAGLPGARRLGTTLWLADGPPGAGALELANRLHASGLFASAQPNWWVERTLK